jgi:hypothetical protein
MSQELPHIIPTPPAEVEETFAGYHATIEFYDEVQARQELKRYCEWYYRIAESHRQELEIMRGELNIFRWFRRR